MTRRLVTILASMILLAALAVPASAATWKTYGPWYCDSGNWRWWYDGQKERLVYTHHDTNDDGIVDWTNTDIEEGSCCNL